MSPRTRTPAITVGLAALVVTGALTVGGHDGPDGASSGVTPDLAPSSSDARLVTSAEFCRAFDGLVVAYEQHLAAASPRTVATLQDAAAQVAGLTDGVAMPRRALAGLQYVIDAIADLAPDATGQDLVSSDDTATVTDAANADAFAAHLAAHCGDAGLSQAR